jgi:hypothetical protein
VKSCSPKLKEWGIPAPKLSGCCVLLIPKQLHGLVRKGASARPTGFSSPTGTSDAHTPPEPLQSEPFRWFVGLFDRIEEPLPSALTKKTKIESRFRLC